MKNILGNILPIAGFVCILTGIAGLINKLFDTNIGIYETEVPTDTVIIAILMFIGAVCLVLTMFGNRNVAPAGN